MGKKVAHVACGGFHSAAILDSGELYTWGGGEHGQVCDGFVFVCFGSFGFDLVPFRFCFFAFFCGLFFLSITRGCVSW